MKNFKQEKYKQDRNNLRYLITDPFSEHPSLTILNFIKNRVFIKNKSANYTSENSKFCYELILANKTGFISVGISKDHLITAKVSYNIT